MKEVIEFLEENRVLYLATTGLDGTPRVRPVQFMLANAGKLWFTTANTKMMYKEIIENPRVEYSITNNKRQWIRINATAVFYNDMTIKERIVKENPTVKHIYKEATNPILETYYLKDVVATIYQLGKEPKSYKF